MLLNRAKRGFVEHGLSPVRLTVAGRPALLRAVQGKGISMKREYEKPVLTKRETLSKVTAVAITSNIQTNE